MVFRFPLFCLYSWLCFFELTEQYSMLEVVKNACIYLRFESPKVCEGAVKTFGRQVATIVERVDLSPEDLCYLIFPDRCSISRLSSTTRHWNISLPTLNKTSRSCGATFKNESILKVLQLSDIHVDKEYSPGSDAECGKPICCRGPPLSQYQHGEEWSRRLFSIISKFLPRHEKTEAVLGAGKWGDYRQCDLPLWTLENLLETVSHGSYEIPEGADEKRTKIDYIVWTGDVTSHDVWAQDKSSVKETLKYLTNTITRHFPDTKVFPTAGNHDSFPPNYFPPSASSWIYNTFAEVWSDWLPSEALETVRMGAYYTVLVYPGFRVVSLNTNFCYAENWWLYVDSKDPAGMLAWFVRVLTEAENAEEKVHVIGHVPPGRSPDCLETWSRNYYRIIKRFECTITAQFYGHTHFDELEVFYDGTDPEPFAVAYLAPSVTPYTNMNPAFRVYDVVKGFWTIENFRTYDLDLDQANLNDRPIWKLEYEAKRAYNLANLTAKEWGQILLSWKEFFEKDPNGSPPETLLRYLQFYSRFRFGEPLAMENSGNSNLPCADMTCAREVVCNIIKPPFWDICRI